MAINLNDEKYATKEAKAIFNKGVAGLAKGVATVAKRGKDEKETAPDYKIVVTDVDGGAVDYPIFIKEEFKSDAGETFYVNALKHIVTKVFKAKQPEGNFETYKELTDAIMNACKNGKAKVDVFTDYGKKGNEKGFIQISSAFNIVNSEFAPLNVYKEGDYNLVRVVADKDKPSSAYSAPTPSVGSEEDSW